MHEMLHATAGHEMKKGMRFTEFNQSIKLRPNPIRLIFG
jgi:hypothetical protein